MTSEELAKLPHVQWNLDNIEDIERLLSPFETRMRQDGDDLYIQGWAGLNLLLHPGDCLVIDTSDHGDTLGVLRALLTSEVMH